MRSPAMGDTLAYSILCILVLAIATKLFLRRTRKKFKNLPPSPPGLPVIRHLHLLLKKPIHRAIHELSQKYGPEVLSLKLGTRSVVVVSSPSAVEECFTTNDLNWANRPRFPSSKYISYNNTTLVSSSYGDHWCNLRRLCVSEIFSPTRLNKFKSIREDEVKIMLGNLRRLSNHGFAKIELRSMFLHLNCNIIMRMVAGKRYYGDDVNESEEAREFKELLEEYVEATVLTRVTDLFPILEPFDFGGSMKKLAKFSRKLDVFFQRLVDEHRDGEERNTMISHLLALQEAEPEYYTDQIIKGLVLMMLFAGTEPPCSSLEWLFCNLLNNPKVLKKAQAEIDAQIGQDRLIEESDLSKLHYLQQIIWENSRLYPVVPLLVPHMSSADCTIGGYDVPSGTILFANAWGMHRDPKLWDDPLSFIPERFEDQEVPKLLTFGMGRRICPGDGLSNRVMALTLASLIQCFDWKKMNEEEIDMTAKVTITMYKEKPLELLCNIRPNLNFALL